MKTVTLTELKNNFSRLMDLVKKGRSSLLVYERNTPVIKVIFAGTEHGNEDEHDIAIARLERAGLVRRGDNKAISLAEIRNLRVVPEAKNADLVAAVTSNRGEDR